MHISDGFEVMAEKIKRIGVEVITNTQTQAYTHIVGFLIQMKQKQSCGATICYHLSAIHIDMFINTFIFLVIY